MSPTRVALVGAAGETGTSIVNGLVEAGGFSITALVRPTSINKPANTRLRDLGIDLVPVDLSGPEDKLVEALRGIDVVVASVSATEQYAQIPLATAAKKAGVKRFVPCSFITIAPPGGIMVLRDWKEDVYNHIKQIKLPYTFIDVGWWYQISIPRLPSGKIDYLSSAPPFNTLVNDGNTPSALTDVRDIGRYVSAVIVDSRTLNKYVLAYDEVWKPNDVYEAFEQISGEKIPREYVSEAQLRKQLADAEEIIAKDPKDFRGTLGKVSAQYAISWGVRGDNTPEYAKFLGYVTSKELYPDLKYRTLKEYLHEVLEGNAKAVYQDNEDIKQLQQKK